MKIFAVALFGIFLSTAAWAVSWRSVDDRAINAPATYDDSLPRLVGYLTEPYAGDEEKKARVILAWIVSHIDYDNYKAKTALLPVLRYSTPTGEGSGDIFDTRVGLCGDIADLYQRMAGLAGLDSVVVEGIAGYNLKRTDVEKQRHAWNAVKINGQWRLLDPTWAMRGDYKVFSDIKTAARHELELRRREQNPIKTKKNRPNRSVDDRWFFTDPKEMAKTHFPNNSRWQLLPVPKSISTFLN